MKTITLLALCIFVFVNSRGQASEADRFFPIEASHSYIEFSVKYMGYAKVKGRFADFSGMIRYDDKDVSKMSATIVVKVESIDTDLEFRDNDLKSENWFDARQFPVITFQSRKAVATAAGFDVTGDLTIKGITKETTIHMSKPSGILKDVRSDAQVILTGSTAINRIDFNIQGKNWSGVKEGIAAVENDVTLEFSLLGKQIRKENFTNWVGNVQTPPGKLYAIAREQGVKEAVTAFEKMKQANAVREFALLNVSYMLQLDGRNADAITLLEANKAAFPEVSSVYQRLGQAYLREGDREKAKENLQAAVEKDKNNAEATELLRHVK